MGIMLYSGDTSFECSYDSWYQIRNAIIKATMDYIQSTYEKDIELYSHLTKEDEKWIGIGSLYNYYVIKLLELRRVLEKQQDKKKELDDTIGVFNRMFIQAYSNMDVINLLNALNFFDIGGLYALCNQSDCEGYYTPGNSLDICALLDRIEPFLKRNNFDLYEGIYIQEGRTSNRLYDIFEHSYRMLCKVNII